MSLSISTRAKKTRVKGSTHDDDNAILCRWNNDYDTNQSIEPALDDDDDDVNISTAVYLSLIHI